MRAKDLIVDGTTEYYRTDSNSWLKWTHQAERAVIVDARVGRWIKSVDRNTLEESWQLRTIGSRQEVLVDLYPAEGRTNPDGTPRKPRRAAVRTQHLRGLWDECVKQRADLMAERRTEEQQRQAAYKAINDPCVEAATALTELGIRADEEGNLNRMWSHVVIGHRSIPALLSAIEHLKATGWRPPAA